MLFRSSIITIAYNSEKCIARTIESVLRQTYQEIEYFIIDGASTDQTVELANSYSKAFKERGIDYHVYSEPDHGIYDAMNKGILYASGDIIGIINSGDWYEPIAVEAAARTFQKTKCDLMYANIRMFKKDGTTFIKKAGQRSYQTSRDWNHPTTFVAAAYYKKYPFKNIGIHDDYGFFLQMKRLKIKMIIVPRVLANFEMGGTSNHKNLRAACKRISDRYRYCYRINGYSRLEMMECVAIEEDKMI